MNQEAYRRIVSGEKQGWHFTALRGVLRLFSWLYQIVVGVRNICYDKKLFRSYSVSVPVISIGNITAGGTGKTPLVIWLSNILSAKGLRCSILTRGYRRQPGNVSDEPALLAKTCSDTSVIINPNRVAGAQKAISVYHAQVLIMDDGFQHRKLRRDLDIVLIDVTCPFGFGRMLPAGYLRESPARLSRASAVIITRADQVPSSQIEALRQQIFQYAGDIPIATTIHRHIHAVSYPNRIISLDDLRKGKIFAFCGIGNPDAFFNSLTESDIPLCDTQTFDDHHMYTPDDMADVCRRAGDCQASIILCTQKDWIKSALLLSKKERFVFAYLAMELDFLDGLDKIMMLIDDLFDANDKMANDDSNHEG